MSSRRQSAPADQARRAAADVARRAAADAAVDMIVPHMTIGLGSGRAVWRMIDMIAKRPAIGRSIRVAVASPRTDILARSAGLHVIELDGRIQLDLMLDGADEIDGELRMIKGGGGALLREKIVAAASSTMVVAAESVKQVPRLGTRFKLPVEVVTFAWRDVSTRLGTRLTDPQLRHAAFNRPYHTPDGHLILDCGVPPDCDLEALAAWLDSIPGVVEHGLFLDQADLVVLGFDDGSVQTLTAQRTVAQATAPTI